MYIEHEQVLDELSWRIRNSQLKHANTVIIGDNSTGKSKLLDRLNNSDFATLISNIKSDSLCDTGKAILVDNIEVGLSFEEIYNVNEFLMECFGEKSIVIVTHSLELVSRLRDFNIINICSTHYGIYDGNDFTTYDDVRNIVQAEDDAISVTLVTLLNLKINNLWTHIENNRFLDLKNKVLSKRQQHLVTQIESL